MVAAPDTSVDGVPTLTVVVAPLAPADAVAVAVASPVPALTVAVVPFTPTETPGPPLSGGPGLPVPGSPLPPPGPTLPGLEEPPVEDDAPAGGDAPAEGDSPVTPGSFTSTAREPRLLIGAGDGPERTRKAE
jgi:hypothetical protein